MKYEYMQHQLCMDMANVRTTNVLRIMLLMLRVLIIIGPFILSLLKLEAATPRAAHARHGGGQ